MGGGGGGSAVAIAKTNHDDIYFGIFYLGFAWRGKPLPQPRQAAADVECPNVANVTSSNLLEATDVFRLSD